MGMLRRAFAPILCATLGCGPPPAPAKPVAPVRSVKHYQPLEMKPDVKLPGLAVILGTDETDGSTLLPIPVGPRSAVVDALYVNHDGPAPASGGVIAVTLTAAPTELAIPNQPGAPSSADAPSPPGATGAPHATGAPDATGAPGATDASGAPPPYPRSSPGSPDPASAAGPRNPADASNTPNAAAAPLLGTLDVSAAASWQASLWSAALVAAATLGKDPADVAFTVAPPVPGDGAAASALLAAGFLAARTGERVDPAVTLTGLIQPDGTIGPVAGVPEQLLAAIARGKTRLGYPSGMRLATSLAGKEVDVVRLARDHGAEAVELASVYDAYQLMTRKALPAPVPVSEGEMAIDPDRLDRLGASYLGWRKRLADEWAELLQLEQAGRLPAIVKRLVRFAQERSTQAEALQRAGKLPAAHGRVIAAWSYAAAANTTHAVLVKLQAGDLDGAVAALTAAHPTEAGAGPALSRIGALGPATLGGELGMLAAFQAALRGWGQELFAAESSRAAAQFLAGLQGKSPSELGSPATADAVANALAPTALARLRALAEAAVAEQRLEPDGEPSAKPRGDRIPHACTPASLGRLAMAFQLAAAAGLRHVDGVIARRSQITEDAARQRIASDEPDYVLADALSRSPAGGPLHELAVAWGEDSTRAALLWLAGREIAYHNAALLIAKYDSLAAHVDHSGRIDAVAHGTAVRNLVANARRAARAAARAARIATGAIPAQARLAYQLADINKTITLDNQLDALGQLWRSTAFSQLAVMLARN